MLQSGIDFGKIFGNLYESMGFVQGNWQNYVMLLISFVLMFLAVVKKFEPMLLLPIAFGMFLINIPGAEAVLWGKYETPAELSLGVNGSVENVGVYSLIGSSEQIYVRADYYVEGIITYYKSFADLQNGISATMPAEQFNTLYSLSGYIQGTVVDGVAHFTSGALVIDHAYEAVTDRGLLWYLYFGVDKVIYPPLIFLGIGAMTDFGPLIANPKSMLRVVGRREGHRRRRRTYRNNGYFKACFRLCSDDSDSGVFVYGAYTYNTKAFNARAYDQKGEGYKNETSPPSQQNRKDSVPYNSYARRRYYSSRQHIAFGDADAR